METIATGTRKGWFKTANHEYVGKTALSVSLIEYRIVSYLPQFDEFETERSEGKSAYQREAIEEDLRRYENLQRNGFIHPFEFI